MRCILFLIGYVLLLWVAVFPSSAESSPDVYRMTEESGQNIDPLLEVDSEGRIWMAWQRNQGSDRSIHTRAYDGNAWSSEMAAIEYRGKTSFDMAADEEGNVWIGWTAWDDDHYTVGASSHLEGAWQPIESDTIDAFQSQIDPWISDTQLSFHNDSLRMVIPSSPPVIYDFSTDTFEKLIEELQDREWFRPSISLSQIGDENAWMVFDFTRGYNMPVNGYTDLLPTAFFFSQGDWSLLRIDSGAYSAEFGPIYRHVSVKSVGSNSEDRAYVTCSVDEGPVVKLEHLPEVTCFFNAHLEVWSFDASTGDTLSFWNLDDAEPSTSSSVLEDGIEVATTDESDVVGFAVSRSGNTSLRALQDPVWYKPVYLEEDSTVTSQHPSTVVDRLGNIWVAWDNGTDIYLSSVRLSDMEVDDVLTSVEADAEGVVAAPAKFFLTPNYPNPFNAATSIGLSIPFETTGTLAIYDVLGQQVRTLIEGDLTVGEHSIVWDGRDDTGRDVSSGVYLCRLAGNGGALAETKKMVLIR
ncbi:MAG: FlgD immunoglobulin-like domain containing protein [Candidatus Latescibacterota bacterium]